jgi:hypothetical protein
MVVVLVDLELVVLELPVDLAVEEEHQVNLVEMEILLLILHHKETRVDLILPDNMVVVGVVLDKQDLQAEPLHMEHLEVQVFKLPLPDQHLQQQV